MSNIVLWVIWTLILIAVCAGLFAFAYASNKQNIELSQANAEAAKYSCTPEQMLMVEREFKICSEGYLDSYCYRTAKISNCTKRGE